jgi:hypothetical protein
MTKQFDWEKCAKRHSPTVVAFLSGVQGTPISEDEFAARLAALPREGRVRLSRSRRPSKGRQMYRNLRDEFSFFVQ